MRSIKSLTGLQTTGLTFTAGESQDRQFQPEAKTICNKRFRLDKPYLHSVKLSNEGKLFESISKIRRGPRLPFCHRLDCLIDKMAIQIRTCPPEKMDADPLPILGIESLSTMEPQAVIPIIFRNKL